MTLHPNVCDFNIALFINNRSLRFFVLKKSPDSKNCVYSDKFTIPKWKWAGKCGTAYYFCGILKCWQILLNDFPYSSLKLSINSIKRAYYYYYYHCHCWMIELHPWQFNMMKFVTIFSTFVFNRIERRKSIA